MSSAKKVRVSTVLEDDDDRSAGGFSANSSISGSSLIGTGQGAPSFCEVTSDLCRAISFGRGKDNKILFLCAKPKTCGSRGHDVGRAPGIRGVAGYYKVASVTKSTGVPLRVFADSLMSLED